MRGWVLRSVMIALPVVLLLAGPGAAQEAASASSHEQAARELYRLLGVKPGEEGFKEVMEGLSQGDPSLARYEDVVRAWYQKAFADGDVELAMARFYMEMFSEPELRELVAFYKRPVGQKALALTDRSFEMLRQRAKEHATELEDMLVKAQKEREGHSAIADKKTLRQTVVVIRDVGKAMFAWQADQVKERAGEGTEKGSVSIIDLKQFSRISREEVVKLLVPRYLQTVPEKDGWGHAYEFYLNTSNLLAPQVMCIRSPGRDGVFSGGEYNTGSFNQADVDEDIVWADGYFIRWPQLQASTGH